MPSRRALLCSAPVALALPALVAPRAQARTRAGASGVVYIVRHAEKASDPQQRGDPPLRAEGLARAQALARLVAGVGLRGVWASAYVRTQTTAAPSAAAAGLNVQTHDPHDSAGLAHQVRTCGGPCLVVGHTNTVGKLVAALGGPTLPDLADTEYDVLDIVFWGDDHATVHQRLRLGAPCG